MKKNVIALMLSFVMTAGSIGTAPVLAAENGATEVETAAEAAESEEILEEHQPEEYPAVPIELEEEAAENYAQDELEEASGEETDGEYNDLTDQSVDNEMDSLDQEDVQQDADAEGVSEGTAEKETLSPDSAVPEELRTEQTTENKMTPDQIQAFQDCVKIWKTDNRVTIVYDSTEDVQLEYSLYSGITDELLYTGDLEWDEESGLYYGSVDFDAVNEASGQTSGNSKTNIKGIPVRILLENNADQDDGGVERFEEIVSQDSGIVTIDTDTKTEGQIIVKWNSIDNDEIDGYSVIVHGENENAPLLVYDTACSTDDTNDRYEILDADHTGDDQITLNTVDENVNVITVAAYKYYGNTGMKHYGEATEYEIVEEEISESVTNKSKKGDAEYIVIEGRCGDSARFVLTGASPDAETDLTMTITGTGVITQARYNEFSEDYGAGLYGTGYMVVGGEMVRKVIIEEGVTEIGSEFFKDYSKLEIVTIPNSVTSIGESAFYNCESLASITIPDSVISIGNLTFYSCDNLTSITIPDSVTSIGNGAFCECWNLASITIPDSVTSIEASTFSVCVNLASITIPESVASIGNNAFSMCSSLTSITIPESVTSIGESAFYGCNSLMEIHICSLEEWLDIDDMHSDLSGNLYLNNTLLTSVVIPDGITNIRNNAFNGCSGLTSVTIPESVTSIGDDVFRECNSLTNMIIPESVTSIGESAFSHCSNLTNIVIPEGVMNIESYTFDGCSSLANIVFPKAMTSIGASAFSGCSSLISITIPVSVTRIGKDAFSGTSGLKEIHISSLEAWLDIDDMHSELSGNLYLNNTLLTSVIIPDEIINIRHNAFNGCSSLISVTIPESVKSIGDNTFKKCNSLTSIIIPNGVMSIGKAAFSMCSNLTSITIPESVMSIGDSAFKLCNSLTSMTIPNGVARIEDSTFYECQNLVSVIIPDGVTSIGHSAFSGCESLTNVAVPDGVTFIGDSAFADCRSFTNITIPDGVTFIGTSVFNRCRNLTNVIIPDGVTIIGQAAFSSCSSLENLIIPDSVTKIQADAFSRSGLVNVDIPDGVTSIGYGAFSFCDSLTNVTIPDSVKNIYGCAFDGCKNLTNVTIQDGVTSIGDEAFYYCLNLESVTIPASVTSIGSLAFSRAIESYIPIEKLTIYGYRGTYAEEYANQYGIPFIDLDEINGKEMTASGILQEGDGWKIHWECNYLESKQGKKSKAHLKIYIEGSNKAVGFIILHKEGEDSLYPGPWIAETGLSKEDFLSVFVEGSSVNPLWINTSQFKDYTSLEEITLSKVEGIDSWAFENCTALTRINGFDETLETIGSEAFKNTGLTAVNLPSSLTILGEYAFASCRSLAEADIPSSVKSLEKGVFSDCTALTEITISDGITKIGERTFFCCDNLTKAVIPKSVTSIGSLAFSHEKESYIPIEKLTIYGYSGSKAEQHANEYGIPFKALDKMSWDNQGLYSPYKTIALQATSTGRYITCDVGSTDDKGKFSKMDKPDLNADATKIQWYEKFELVPCSDGSYALRSVVNRQYLSYTIAKTALFAGYQLMCIADFVKTDEKLILSPGSSGVIKFQKDDHWLCVENGKLKVTDDINKAETFNQILLDDNQYADKELDILTSDEWFDLYGQDKGGYYDIQEDVGKNTPQNASTLRKLGYTLMNTSARIGKYDYIELGDNMHKMQCFVAYKETGEHCDVIIAFQGTGGYGDDFPDALISTEGSGDPEDGKHKGYQGMATILISNETGIISEKDTDLSLSDLISEYKDRNVRFTILGHSMGGAIAQCYALHLAGKGIPKKEIRGRTFNSALAVSKDDTGFEDWYNLCVSTDSVCNGVITGSILSYGRHEIGKTIWLYDHEAELLEPYYTFDVISQPKHAMGKDKCLYKILSSFRKDGKCDHVWDTGKITISPSSSEEGERTYTCTKCGKTRTEKIPPFDLIDVGGVESKLCSGTAVTQNPVVKLGDKILEENTDYVISYSNNINVGTVTMTISGIGDYSGTVTRSFYILPGKTSRGDMFNLANNVKVTWKEIPGAKYYKVYREGVTDPKETRKDPVIVTTGLIGWDAQPGLTSGHAYRYKVVASLTGKGDSSGDSTTSYSKLMYRLKTVVIRSAKNTSAGKVTVTYDKTTCGDSYVLQYSDNKDMDGATTKVIKGASNNSCTIGGLKKGKTYYFSIRVRKSVNGVLYYTTFGVAKKVVITK